MTTKTPATGKIAKVKKEKKVKPSVKFVSFTVTAVIPTQQYGNIQPKIEVEAKTYEQARDFVMPLIQELYATYGERPLVPKITETVKVVSKDNTASATTHAPVPKEESPASPSSPVAPVVAPEPTSSTTPETSSTPPAAPVQKPEPVLKAEKAIKLAMTEEAAILIHDQIERSVKIPPEFKSDLLNACAKRRNELKTK